MNNVLLVLALTGIASFSVQAAPNSKKIKYECESVGPLGENLFVEKTKDGARYSYRENMENAKLCQKDEYNKYGSRFSITVNCDSPVSEYDDNIIRTQLLVTKDGRNSLMVFRSGKNKYIQCTRI